MPRPGPRPYECVRRAWHSERHQPMRGSLIKEIFRVVGEIHSPATRKNKEWQEKLPIVVLKAEEIMYSKANSEAEYMDLNTLWDRANDAINTIIRIDESAETGVLMQPCIEAALILGCTPRRTSRSQRNSDPRCYLGPTAPEPTCVPPNNLEHVIQGNCITNTPFMPHNSNVIKPIPMSLTAHKFPFLSGNFPPCLPRETYVSSNPCSIYPLYYGSELQYQESQFSFRIPDSDDPNAVKTGHEQSPFPRDVASTKIPRADLWDGPDNPLGTDCDLSLRLGPLSVPCISVENSWPREVEDVDSSTSRECKMSSDLTLWMDKEFSFFPKANTDDLLESCSSKLRSEAENMNVEKTLRKRKSVFGNPSKDWELCFRPKLPCSPPHWKMSNAGS
ncbi:uncharacterized protein LOC130757665 [Actinidia eriantha]|uniref:uncharacterized protein LOC130757665 n=1 Tax=Actinidia eriantha TaxID=165200 RepID=UPI002586E933|nr:uncharacterized protein LOC130757665 [Actinidia eriantha]